MIGKTLTIIIFSAIVSFVHRLWHIVCQTRRWTDLCLDLDDGQAKDFQGNNQGNIIGGIEVVDGKSGKALNFNGTDGYIQIPHNETMNVIANGFYHVHLDKSSAGTMVSCCSH